MGKEGKFQPNPWSVCSGNTSYILFFASTWKKMCKQSFLQKVPTFFIKQLQSKCVPSEHPLQKTVPGLPPSPLLDQKLQITATQKPRKEKNCASFQYILYPEAVNCGSGFQKSFTDCQQFHRLVVLVLSSPNQKRIKFYFSYGKKL